MEPDKLLSRISESIHGKDPFAVAYLFGSRARGDNRSNSDWDILILVNERKVTNEIEDKFRDGLYDIELESGSSNLNVYLYKRLLEQNPDLFSII
ncbi:MAG TPA: hypothetical protein DD653_13105 [Marinilabiliales bacterium]|jgi:predicted nucleotidyltransferase|nr:hypothetical protein [Marinilabiliales bacterium]